MKGDPDFDFCSICRHGGLNKRGEPKCWRSRPALQHAVDSVTHLPLVDCVCVEPKPKEKPQPEDNASQLGLFDLF